MEEKILARFIHHIEIILKINKNLDLKGDSGGGLYVFDASINRYVVIGITRLV